MRHSLLIAVTLALALATLAWPAAAAAAAAHRPAGVREHRCTSQKDCVSGEYCKLDNELGCEGSGECAKMPQMCIEVFNPVCGCDGRSYGNPCQAAEFGSNVHFHGVCPRKEEDDVPWVSFAIFSLALSLVVCVCVWLCCKRKTLFKSLREYRKLNALDSSGDDENSHLQRIRSAAPGAGADAEAGEDELADACGPGAELAAPARDTAHADKAPLASQS